MTGHLPLSLRRSSIALVVSVALVTVITLVLGTFAALFYNSERVSRFEELRAALAVSADQLAVAVALPAWNFDDTQITAIMSSGLNSRNLQSSMVSATANKRNYVLSRNERGQPVMSDTAPTDPDLLVEQRPIQVAGQRIGTVSVYATPRFVLEELRQRRLAIIAVIVVLDLALVLSVYLLLWHLTLKPLKVVGEYAAAVMAGRGVVNAPGKVYFFGELRTLNQAIRDMIALLDSRYRAMRESEERLTIATRAASVGIWDWDIVTDELVWDEQTYRNFRVEKGQFSGCYQAWAATLLPEDLEPAGMAVAAALRGEREYAHEFRIVWPDGTIRYIKVDSLTFRDVHGKPLRMVGVNYDITESKLAQQELLQHRNHLEELVDQRTQALSVAVTEAKAANRAKSVFLATMSHELRTPLNSVIGFSRLMADSTSMLPEEKRNLAIIHRSGQHLLTLINDILELSKIEAGRVQVQTQVIDLNELLHEVIDMVSARAHQFGLTLTLDCANAPDAARVDGAKLRQVLLNLMSNAVKFVEKGGVTLAVRGAPMDGGRWMLTFAVSDSGVGIAPADQERIFEPFIQAETAGAKDGTGLGLTISREFVHLMGGKLSVESEPGVGSVFSFSIPVEAADSAPAAHVDEVTGLVPGQLRRRVLVVDDNRDGRMLLHSLLTPLGFLVAEAADGRAALSEIASSEPELVFMDWRMPGLDGLAVTRSVRSLAGLVQPRIVMLTASAFEEEKQEALAAGADDFLRKPVEQDKLYQILEQHLGVQFVRRQRERAAAPPRRLDGLALERLPTALLGELRSALQELNMARVAQMLAPLDASYAEVVAGIEQMLAQHQYPQLCALIDALAQKEVEK